MYKPIQILIVEDDLLIAEMLKEMLLELNYCVTGIAKNFAIATARLQTDKNIDLCFLDINLEDSKTGIDIAKEINEKYKVPFVFLTSYSDSKTISEAAALHPEAYLVKPFSITDLLTTIEIIAARKRNQAETLKNQTYIIKDRTQNIKLNISEIKWLRSDNVYVEVVTNNKTYVVRTSLEKIMEELNHKGFVRTHRSYVVNLDHVNAVSGQYLYINNEKIPISRKLKDEIRSIFNA